VFRQAPRGRAARRPAAGRLARGAALAGTLALLPLTTACDGGDKYTDTEAEQAKASVTAAPAAGVVAPAKVEVIAGLTGCKAKIRVEADELREGVCHTKDADYLITTFPAEKYKRSWLDAASVYGGTYLVGTRWVVSGKPRTLEGFRSVLGGTVQELRGMASSPAPSAS
jgi:hypothetical protein